MDDEELKKLKREMAKDFEYIKRPIPNPAVFIPDEEEKTLMERIADARYLIDEIRELGFDGVKPEDIDQIQEGFTYVTKKVMEKESASAPKTSFKPKEASLAGVGSQEQYEELVNTGGLQPNDFFIINEPDGTMTYGFSNGSKMKGPDLDLPKYIKTK